MKNHNTHYATLREYRQLCDGSVFVIVYTYPVGTICGYLTQNRRISPMLDRAKVFFDYDSARRFVPFDYELGTCCIYEFRFKPQLRKNVLVRVFRHDSVQVLDHSL